MCVTLSESLDMRRCVHARRERARPSPRKHRRAPSLGADFRERNLELAVAPDAGLDHLAGAIEEEASAVGQIVAELALVLLAVRRGRDHIAAHAVMDPLSFVTLAVRRRVDAVAVALRARAAPILPLVMRAVGPMINAMGKRRSVRLELALHAIAAGEV